MPPKTLTDLDDVLVIQGIPTDLPPPRRGKIRLIINQGTAGATDPDLKVFDIVIGESAVDYGAFGSAPG